jgi:hypothetical protein
MEWQIAVILPAASLYFLSIYCILQVDRQILLFKHHLFTTRTSCFLLADELHNLTLPLKLLQESRLKAVVQLVLPACLYFESGHKCRHWDF